MWYNHLLLSEKSVECCNFKSFLCFSRCPLEMNLSEEMSLVVTEMEEGKESKLFWSTVGGKRSSYLSLRKGKKILH